MQMRHDHECHDYLYIEKVCQLVDGNQAYDTQDKERGLYLRVKMIKYNTQDKLKFISYYRSSFYFLFVFQYDHSCYFFMRKTILEVQNMDVSRGSEICLINDLSYINVLIEPTKVKRCTFIDMKHIQKM